MTGMCGSEKDQKISEVYTAEIPKVKAIELNEQ